MTLSEAQRLFSRLLGQFLVAIYQQPGLSVTMGECYRTTQRAAENAAAGTGISNSLHCKRLAVDLNLFVGDIYQMESEEYAVLGAIWKGLNPLCRWGGDFKSRPDGNHFSIEFEGVK